ncbi:MAG: caspase family protein, partial [Archangiaceae bacterium]|nr:caspase family protein [Archangiaceae bacterium]
DVAQRREGLRIPGEAPAGTYFLIDRRGVVVAEITKSETERTIALSPGTYTVKRRLTDRLRVGEVRVVEGQLSTLDEAQLKNAKFSDDPVKGTGLTTVYSRHWSISATGQYQAIFDAPTTSGGLFPSAPLVGGEATVHNFFGRGFAWSFDGQYGWSTGVVASARLGTPASYRYSLINVGTSILYEWNQDANWVPFLGARLGLNLMNRQFDDPIFPQQGFTTMTPGVVGGLKYRIGRSFGVVARGRVHYLLYNVDETRSLGFAEVGLLLNYEFRD